MAIFLAMQIRLGKITFDNVPEKCKAEVEKILGDYVTHEDINMSQRGRNTTLFFFT